MRTREKASLWIALPVLLATVFISFQIRRLDGLDSQQARESLRILASANSILSILNTAEAVRRDTQIAARLERELEVLEKITAGRPGQLDRARRLRLAMRKAVADPPQDAGRQSVAEARGLGARIAQQEVAALESGSLESAGRRDQILAVLLTGSLVLFGLIVFGIAGSNARKRRQQTGTRGGGHRTAQIGDLLHATRATSSEAIITADSNGTVTFLNPVARQLTGWPGESALGQNLDAVFPVGEPAGAERPWSAILREFVSVITLEDAKFCPRNGRQMVVGGTAASIRSRRDEMIGLALVFREAARGTDAAEQDEAGARLPAQLRRLQKLETLSALGGAIVHDLNNLLMGVVANVSIMMDEAPQDSPIPGLGESVLSATEQAGHLTRQMLGYSGVGRFATEPLHLGNQVKEISSLAKTSIPQGVRLSLNLPAELPLIAGDPLQIQHLAMNLIQNGAEAAGLNGAVTISACTRALRDGEQIDNLAGEPLPAGAYIMLEVKDTGPAVDEATRAEMFDPFSKAEPSDRGVGLAAVLRIVRRHHGGISLVSDSGGTTFAVFFPIRVEAAGPPSGQSRRGAFA